MNLRCRPGDLAVVINARLPSNLGRIVRVVAQHDGTGVLAYPPTVATWLVTSPHSMNWVIDGKRFRRKKGPVPDAQLQPIRGQDLGSDIANGLLTESALSGEIS